MDRRCFAESPNIVLIGMPGAGKTTLGKMLSKRLAKPFIDIDELIEQVAHKSIPSIFQEDGEKVFRRMEREAVASCRLIKNSVIATGGGTVIDDNNVEDLRENGILFFIDSAPNKIWSRPSLITRPLIGKSKENLLLIYRQRRKVYMQVADFVLDNNKGHLRRCLLRVNNIYRRLAR